MSKEQLQDMKERAHKLRQRRDTQQQFKNLMDTFTIVDQTGAVGPKKKLLLGSPRQMNAMGST